ncbi:MAG TPA: TraR/DksA C4-type zinc finger protein [Terriglobia bacterium]|nr:TraR/DksA C4-type zinc finger protein [Terriglobia bacterium]
METILDAHLAHKYWNNLSAAKLQALLEAANTGGAVLEVRSIEIGREALLFIGLIPDASVGAKGNALQRRPMIVSRSLGNFHTTWAALLGASEHTLGFLVLHHPLTLRGVMRRSDREDVWVAAQVKRDLDSLPPMSMGDHCCNLCNEPIAKERLRAIPGVRICTKCQTIKEEMKS